MSDNQVEAHILPRRREGDVEIVGMELFNSDGSPYSGGGGGGSSEMVYSGVSMVEHGVFADTDTVMPFGNAQITYVAGLDVTPGDLTIDAPKGMYLVKMTPAWGGWEETPTEGWATATLAFVYPNPEDPEVSNEFLLLYMETNAEPEPGEISFDQGSVTAMTVNPAPGDGYFELRGTHSLSGESLDLNIDLTIAKL